MCQSHQYAYTTFISRWAHANKKNKKHLHDNLICINVLQIRQKSALLTQTTQAQKYTIWHYSAVWTERRPQCLEQSKYSLPLCPKPEPSFWRLIKQVMRSNQKPNPPPSYAHIKAPTLLHCRLSAATLTQVLYLIVSDPTTFGPLLYFFIPAFHTYTWHSCPSCPVSK